MAIEKALLYTVGKGKFEDVNTESLMQITKDYPFFATAQVLMAVKLKENGLFFQDQYNEQLSKAKLFSNNPLWIDYVLNDNDQYLSLDLENSNPTAYNTTEQNTNEATNNKQIKPNYTFEEKPFVHPFAKQVKTGIENQEEEFIGNTKFNKTKLKKSEEEEKKELYIASTPKQRDFPKNYPIEVDDDRIDLQKPFAPIWQTYNETDQGNTSKKKNTTTEQIDVKELGNQSPTNWEIDSSAPSKIVSAPLEYGKHLDKVLGETVKITPKDLQLTGPSKIIFEEAAPMSAFNYEIPSLDSIKDTMEGKNTPRVNETYDKKSEDEIEIGNLTQKDNFVVNKVQEVPLTKPTPIYSNPIRPIDKFGFVDIPSFENETEQVEDADDTDLPQQTLGSDDKTLNATIPIEQNVMISSILGNQIAEFRKPIKEEEKLDFEKEPYFTIDYFDSLGIKVDLSKLPQDKFTSQLRRFTDWLKYMKKIDPNPSDLGTDPELEKAIEDIAKTSISSREIVTETMADVFVKQGKVEKAIQLYIKLSFMEPDKSAYFAAKIQHLKGI